MRVIPRQGKPNKREVKSLEGNSKIGYASNVILFIKRMPAMSLS